jgi:hypothetical protein
MRTRWALGLLALLACADDNHSLAPLLNRCTQQFDCVHGTCDPLGICTQSASTKPYDFRLQVTPPASSDAGLFAIRTTERITLDGSVALSEIQLAKAVFLSGRVLASDGATALEAELVFTPRDPNALGGALSTFTGPDSTGRSFAIQLVPNRTYDVLVYPRGPDSAKFPPYSFEQTTGDADESHDFVYPALVELKGQIRQENDAGAPLGARVKTRWRDRMVASSSLAEIEAQGSFSVLAPQAVLDSPEKHELVLDLSESTFGRAPLPQNVQIVFDMSKPHSDGRWTMPVLPAPVVFSGSVEISALSNQSASSANVDAQLSWISDFAPPSGDDDKRQTDWCMLRLPGAPKDTFRCSAYVTSNVGADRQVEVLLLPGVYDVVITPLGSLAQVLTPHRERYTIESQPINGIQEGYTFMLNMVTYLAGKVTSASDSKPMPSVTVTARALGVRDGLPEIALYNRSSSQATDATGRFRLAIDVGVYDLIATPPEGSGYAWVLRTNGPLDGKRTQELGMHPQFPVLARGRVVSPSDAGVAMATVNAYAMVPDLAGGTDRAVLIARTTTDSRGDFALQMPPRLGAPEDDLPSDAGVGEEVPRDAGVDAQR